MILYFFLFFKYVLCYEAAISKSANIYDYNYVAKVIVYKEKRIFCSGTVVTPKRILTVADCLEGQDRFRPNVAVQFGHQNHTKIYNVSRIHFHPWYNPESPVVYHICLLKLTNRLEFDEKNQGVTISNFLQASLRGTRVVALGFGKRTKNQTYGTMNELLQLKFKMIDGHCSCYHREESQLLYCSTKIQLKDRCGDQFGDVGGPIFVRDSIEGILYTVYSDEKCMPGRYARELAGCDSSGYVVIIPICPHRHWLSSRIQTFVTFHDTCSQASQIEITLFLFLHYFYKNYD